MTKSKIKLLSTKLIGSPLSDLAIAHSFSIDEIPFIETDAIRSSEVKNRIIELSKQQRTVIFTSATAVNAVKEFLSSRPAWKIFCIGYKTKKIVVETFGQRNLIDTADNGEQLAAEIIKYPLQGRIVFFSGNQRRELMPALLKLNGIALEELVVYNTIEKPQVISKIYDGILFFSPSAVRSFFSKNTLSPRVLLFAIGATTANEIKLFTSHPVVTSLHPDIADLIQLVIQHFNTSKIN